MSIFKKKDEDLEEENLEEGRKITKNLKDLKPQNKKKRKEPPKPWGKKERLIVLIVLLATTIVSAILLLSNSLDLGYKTKKVRLPKINLDSINIFKGETIIIEKKQQ
ncbi:MAG: hypothetical protein ACD_13C00232G0003 [uncultured bacterium]|nr:MAG: hypothetical protein ACD_13C00232G0003 [uncultured bacterium]